MTVVLFAGVSPSSAAPITFQGGEGTAITAAQAETNFFAALDTFGTETLDALALGTINPTLTFGATGITAATSNVEVDEFVSVSPPYSLVDGIRSESFTFSTPVNGFGAYFLDLEFDNSLTLQLENTVLGTTTTVTFGPFSTGAPAYLGVIDAATPFNRLTLVASVDEDVFNFDNLTAGQVAVPVPEPTSLTLLGLGLAGICARGWRRRRNG